MQSGQILGLFATGILADRYGYKKVMTGAMIWVTGVIFILFFANNIVMLLIGELLMGFPLGGKSLLWTGQKRGLDASPPFLFL